LFWLDLYLTGAEEGFLPPAPFELIEQDDDGPLPERAYTKAELLPYVAACRQRCQATIEALTDESSQRRCRFSWGECSFLELLIYNLRHVQEHTAQLNLLLGQKGVFSPDYKTQLKDETA
ncbi:MAG: DinB family protein, partial [Anaerolineae bacterium]|nr:DinB family protein [Anaerolineae bacterium]